MSSVRVFSDGHGLAEIWQSTRAKMALCVENAGEWETIHNMVKCKDFCHDAVSCMFITGRKSSIYGFKYDPEVNPPVCLDAIQVFVQGISKDDAMTSLKVLNTIETDDMDKSQLMEMDNGFIFIGDKSYLQSPAAISLFTGILRMGQYGPIKGKVSEWLDSLANVSGNDPSYVTQAGGSKCIAKWHKLLNDESIAWASGMYDKMGSGTLHHGCGWVAYCAGLYATSCGDGAFPVK